MCAETTCEDKKQSSTSKNAREKGYQPIERLSKANPPRWIYEMTQKANPTTQKNDPSPRTTQETNEKNNTVRFRKSWERKKKGKKKEKKSFLSLKKPSQLGFGCHQSRGTAT